MQIVVLALSALLAFPCLAGAQNSNRAAKSSSSGLVDSGQSLFQQNCAFCHGRDAAGGETGPDLTSSKLVAEDVDGNKIGAVVLNGRPEKGMPRFDFNERQIAELAAFIHHQKTNIRAGRRRGVSVSDLQTGNAQDGKQYFYGAGNCSSCHSPSGDLAHVATRYQGLKLEERMLYPEGATANATVTLPSGETVSGTLEYRDEFTIGLQDASGWYRSWPAGTVKIAVKAPAEAHVDLLGKYTDVDIHNLMAYLQTLR